MDLLLLTADPQPASVLPAVDLLPMTIRSAPPEAASLVTAGPYDLVLLDARSDLAAARNLCRLLGSDGLAVPILAVVTEGGMVAIGPEWGVADVVLASAGPAEVHARLRLLAARNSAGGNSGLVSLGELTIEEDTYTARLRGRALELTYKEFELLKFLAQHPGRVFTREQLVTEVWGYDFFGGTRTVDVHVRRLRAKLGPEHESLIGTVRNVGYKMVPPYPRPGPGARRGAGQQRVNPAVPTEILRLAARAEARDGVAPLSGHVVEALEAGSLDLVTRAGTDGRPAALAVFPPGDPAELFVVPDQRRQGLGTELLELALGRAGRVWAHGNLPAARALADRAGLRPIRELRQLRRTGSLAGLPPAPTPAGVTVRTFRVGQDEDAFLRVNARAFAWHPEQGRLDATGLADEQRQEWFDPAGFFLAFDAEGRLLGFHWTKVHPASRAGAEAVGEVYVLGVDPAAGVPGLGSALTRIGLEHLRSAGLFTVILYVEGDNGRALGLYDKFGFSLSGTDVVYAR